MSKLSLVFGLLAAYSQVQANTIPVLYGGIGRGSAVNAGAVIIVDQTTGAGTVVGNPAGTGGLTGLAFDPGLGLLFGTSNNNTTFEGGTSQLLRIGLAGDLIGSPVNVTDAGSPIGLNDLAIQPSTGLLYGTSIITTTFTNTIYTLDKVTGVATFVGNTGITGATLAFAPNGNLYMTSAEFNPDGSFLAGFLNTVDPLTGAVLSTSAPFTTAHVGGLAVRPDGVIFASGGMPGDIYTLSPSGTETLVGLTGVGGVGDLAFAVPEPSTFTLLAIGSFVLFLGRNRFAARRTGVERARELPVEDTHIRA
jgi:hypothetical protein